MGDEGVPLFTYPVSNQNRLQYSIGEKKKDQLVTAPQMLPSLFNVTKEA